MERSPTEVGALIRARRNELGLNQEGHPGVSSSTIRKAENGDLPEPRKRAAIARILGWPADAIDRLLRGTDPSDFDPSPSPPASALELAALNRKLSQLTPAQLERIDGYLDALLGHGE